MRDWTRRELLTLMLGAPWAAACARSKQPALAGDFDGVAVDLGHQLRDEPVKELPVSTWHETDVVIVGAGIAGLTAARRLLRDGCENFVVLELESTAGGTSRSGERGGLRFPWGAHYVPVPLPTNNGLIELFEEMGVVEGRDPQGAPIVGEQYLCREPQERLFYQGTWQEDLNPLVEAGQDELEQWQRLQHEFRRWAEWRDGAGRPAFALPTSASSDDAEVVALDRRPFADWLDELGITSPRVRWLVEYACRDDYGTTLDQTSAWAGLFYFSSRLEDSDAAPQPLMTWPEGNGRVVQHLAGMVAARLHVDRVVRSIIPARATDGNASQEQRCQVVAVDHRRGTAIGYRARRVIFAAPQFLAPYLIHGYRDERGDVAAQFTYGSWMVANLHLRDRPRELGFPLAWDNVLYDSPSLGYVTATHQRGIDYGPTIFTYYYPLCSADPRAARQRLLELGWSEWVEVALSDLERAHPDLRSLVERIDVVRWGHAMIRPRPGFLFGPERRRAREPFHQIHFANTDLSGLALLEEAFDHGERAAREALADAPLRGRT